MRLLVALAAIAMLAAPVAGQTTQQIEAAFPEPNAGEMGPQTFVPDGIPIADMVGKFPSIYDHVDGDGAPDVVGAYRVICNDGQYNSDDPIVAPGVKGGAPHQHGWYGNKAGNFASTYASLRTTGDTTCGGKGNRSGYWRPPIIDPVLKKAVRAKFVSLYYKGFPRSSAQCNPNSPQFVGICVPLPNGLKMIYGYDFLTGKSPTGAVRWKCQSQDYISRTDYLASWDQAMAACQPGDDWMSVIDAPSCWNGKDVDSPNHRDHVAYTDEQTGKCPSTHPKHFMHLTQITATPLNANYKQWYLASDRMPGMATLPNGTSMHQDYWMAWNQRILIAVQRNCIDRLLNCNAGDIGNGYFMKPDQSPDGGANPPYAEIPLRRGGTSKGMVHVGH